METVVAKLETALKGHCEPDPLVVDLPLHDLTTCLREAFARADDHNETIREFKLEVEVLEKCCKQRICSRLYPRFDHSFTKDESFVDAKAVAALSRVARGTLLAERLTQRRLRLSLAFDRWQAKKCLPNYERQMFAHDNLSQLMKVMNCLSEIGSQEQKRISRTLQNWKHLGREVSRQHSMARGKAAADLTLLVAKTVKTALRPSFKTLELNLYKQDCLTELSRLANVRCLKLSIAKICNAAELKRQVKRKFTTLKHAVLDKILAEPFSLLASFRPLQSRLHKTFGRLVRRRVADGFARVSSSGGSSSKEVANAIMSIMMSSDRSRKFIFRKYFFKWNKKVNLKRIAANKLVQLNYYHRTRMRELFAKWAKVAGERGKKIAIPLSLKTKMNVLLNCKIFYRKLTSKSAFFKWAVRSRPILIDERIRSFILHNKIKKDVAFLRLCRLSNSYNLKQLTKRSRLPKAKVLAFYIVRGWLKKKLQHDLKVLRAKIAYKNNAMYTFNRFIEILDQEEGLVGRENYIEAFKTMHQKFLRDRSRKKFFIIMLKNHVVLISRGLAKWRKIPDVRLRRRQQALKAVVKKLTKKNNYALRTSMNCLLDVVQQSQQKKYHVFNRASNLFLSNLASCLTHWKSLSFNILHQESRAQVKRFHRALQNRIKASLRSKFQNMAKKHKKLSFYQGLARAIMGQTWQLGRQLMQGLAHSKELVQLQEWSVLNQSKRQALKFIESSISKNPLIAIRCFASFASQEAAVSKYCHLAISSKYSCQGKAFEQWKAIPELKWAKKKVKVALFWENLVKYTHSKLQRGLAGLKEPTVVDRELKRKEIVQQMARVNCNFLRQYLERWILLNRNQNNSLTCHLTISLFEGLCGVLKLSAAPLVSKTKKQAVCREGLERLCSNQLRNQGWVLKHWRKKVQLLKANDSKKQFMILRMRESVESSDSGLLRLTLQHFLKNSKIIKYQENYFARLLQTKYGMLAQLLSVWKSLPDPRNKRVVAKCAAFQQGLLRVARKRLETVVGMVKGEHELGILAEKNAVLILIRKSQSSTLTKFNQWKAMTVSHRLVTSCRLISQMFETLNSAASVGAQMILADPTSTRRMEWAIGKMLEVVRANSLFTLRRWRDNAMQMKLNEEIGNSQKTFCCEFLQKFLDNSQQLQLKLALRVFNTNRRINQIQINFFKSLQNTKVGALSAGFRKWKALPERSNTELVLRAQTFEKGLHKAAFNRLSASLKRLKDEDLEGQAVKKWGIRKLMETACSGEKKFFDLWHRMTEKRKVQNTCRLLWSSLQCLTVVVQGSTSLVLTNVKQNQLKEKYLDLLFSNLADNKRKAFSDWKQDTKVTKLNKQLDRESKVKMISIFQTLLNGNDLKTLTAALTNFKENSKFVQVSNKFFSALNRTKAGAAIFAFKKWADLPDIKFNNAKMRMRKFISRLQAFAAGYVRPTLKALRSETADAERAQRAAIIRLISVTMSGTTKYYRCWSNLVREQKIIQKCIRIKNFLRELNATQAISVMPLLESQKECEKKRKAILRLEANTVGLLGAKFSFWRECVRQMKLKDQFNNEKKKLIMKGIEGGLQNSGTQLLKKTLAQFKRNSSIIEVQVKFFNRLTSSGVGLTMKLFSLWKKLPELSQREQKRKGHIFFRRLSNFANANLSATMKALRSNDDLAELKEKKAVIVLIRISQSGLKRYFTLWGHACKQSKLLLAINRSQSFFERLARVCSSHFEKLADKKQIQQIVDRRNAQLKSKQTRFSNGYAKIEAYLNLTLAKGQAVLSQLNSTALIKKNKLVCAFAEGVKIRRLAALKRMAQVKNYLIAKEKSDKLSGLFQTCVAAKVEELSQLLSLVPIGRRLVAARLLSSARSRTSCLFMCWRREVRRLAQLQSLEGVVRKKAILDLEAAIVQNLNQAVSKQVLGSMVKNKQVEERKIQYYRKCCERSQTNCRTVLESMRKVPEPNFKQRILNMNKFEARLYTYYIKKIRFVHVGLAGQNQEGNKAKRNALVALINKSSGFLKNKFLDWRKEASNLKIRDKIFKCQAFFDSFVEREADNLKLVFDDKNAVLMEKYLTRLTENLSGNLKTRFSFWHKNARQATLNNRMQNEKKVMLISMFEGAIQNNGNKVLKEVLAVFSQNLKIENLQRNFLQRLLQTGAGKQLTALQLWKSLPEKNLKSQKIKAYQFQSRLLGFACARLRQTWRQLRSEDFQAIVNKKNCIRILIQKSMNLEKKLFYKWIHLNKEMKVVVKYDLLANLFRFGSLHLHSLFAGAKAELTAKKKTARRISDMAAARVAIAFKAWKEKQVAFRSGSISGRKCAFASMIARVMQQKSLSCAFRRVDEQAKLTTVRNYINSLWKWKIANTENKHFTEMLRVFRESEQLITFSTLINKRITGTLGSAFRYIYNFNRSSKIEKHLTRLESLANQFLFKLKRKALHQWVLLIKEENSQYWKDQLRLTKNGGLVLALSNKIIHRVKVYKLQSWINRTRKLRATQARLLKLNKIFSRCMKLHLARLKTKAQFIKQATLLRFSQIMVKLAGISCSVSLAQLVRNCKFYKSKVIPLTARMVSLLKAYFIRTGFHFISERAVKKRAASATVQYMGRLLKAFTHSDGRQIFNDIRNRCRLNKFSAFLHRRTNTNTRVVLKAAFSHWAKVKSVIKIARRLLGAQKITRARLALAARLKRSLLGKWRGLSTMRHPLLRLCVRKMALNSKLQPDQKKSELIALWRLKSLAGR